MVNFYIYATDDSGSTNGADYFNKKGLETLKSFQNEVKTLQTKGGDSHKEDRVVYLHWSHRCVRVEEDEVVSRYQKQDGDGHDTLPHTVLDWMAENITETDTVELLYVITDGMVSSNNIRPCDPTMKIDNVTFYAFNKRKREIDMSVASMFICKNKRYLVYCNQKIVDDTDLSTPFDYDQINLENFDEMKEQLKSYIKLQFLTKRSSDQMALDEIKKLRRLRGRLYNKLKIEKETDNESPNNLNVKDKDSFIKQFKRTTFFKTLMNADHYKQKQNIESCINSLLNYINNDKKSFKFDNLKFTQKFALETEQEEVSNVGYENVEEIPFPDIIMANETGVPVILLTHYSLIRKVLFTKAKCGRKLTAHFARFRNLIDCPLVLLRDDNFKSSIEYYYNLEAFKSMISHGIRTGPRTRKEFSGAIVPLEEFDDYNDYILSCTYFAERRVKFNKGLLYYVLYKNCEKLEYIEPNVVEYLKGYVIKRIAKTECYLGLNGLSMEDPLIRVNLTTALWYCLELSSVLFKDDPKHFTKEKMRMYSHFAEYMKEILEWFQYDIDTNMVNLRADIFKYVNLLKRKPRVQDKITLILKQIFKNVDGFLIPEIMKPDNIYKLNYAQMNHKTVINESVVSAEVDVHKFAHFMDCVEMGKVPVCRQTMRPYFVTEDKKSFYEHLMMKTQRVLIENGQVKLKPVSKLNMSRILSLNKLYISFVQENSRFPSWKKYKAYVLRKKQYYRGKPVIFALNVLKNMRDVFSTYKEIIKDNDSPITETDFIKMTKQSVNREQRIKKENPTDFKVEDISNYIKKSESNIEVVSVIN